MQPVVLEARAERRLVTVLFADLAGYTTLCQHRDPEEVHALVRPLMSSLREACEVRHGVVPSIEGDGFMAAFGARSAREDDPVQALRAAVDMQRLVQAHLARMPEIAGLHVGLHVGEVVVSPGSEDAGFALVGDAVNVAARVCSLAAAGEVLVTTEVLGLVPLSAGFDQPRELALRGRSESVLVAAYDWAGVGAPLVEQRWSTLTPYVRRTVSESLLDDVLAGGEHALLLGDAGVGKSRLAQFVLADRPVLAVTCGGHHYPRMRDLLADVLDQSNSRHPALVTLLRGKGQDGVDDAAVLEAAARRLRPEGGRVVLLEEAERLDVEEQAQLDVVLRSSAVPWVVVSRRALPGASLTVVPVPPLEPDEATSMVRALLPDAAPELAAAVVHRAGDSPLFLEQCIRLLVESELLDRDPLGRMTASPRALDTVPTSMRLFVASRLDLLAVSDRERLSVASVLGDVVDVDLLCHLGGCTPEELEPLVERGLLRWAALDKGRPLLLFAHAFVREVTYDTLLRSRRVEIHRAAAEWYAALPASQVLEAQAYHLEAAVRLGDANCDLVRRAVEALVVHARSVEEERTTVADASLRRARELVEGRSECEVPTLQLELASASVSVLMGRFDEAAGHAVRAGEAAEAVSDEMAAAEAMWLRARAVSTTSPAQALLLFDDAVRRYEANGDPTGAIRAATGRALTLGSREGLRPYVQVLERAFQVGLQGADRRLQASAAQALALHHAAVSGRGEVDAWSATASSISRADDVALRPRLALAQAVLAMFGVEARKGLSYVDDALGTADELGLQHLLINSYTVALDLRVLLGRLDEAQDLLDQARAMARRRRGEWWERQLDLQEVRLRQRRGEVPAARRLIADVEQAATDRPLLRREVAEVSAWVDMETGHFGTARAKAVEAALVDEQVGDRSPQLRARLVALASALAMGDSVPLADISTLRSMSRETGLPVAGELASRWIYVDELTQGWSVDLHGLSDISDVVEGQALDLEIKALSERRFDLLPEAAQVWSTLGATVWPARALLWHEVLTGEQHPEALETLRTLQSPDGLADHFRSQVVGLRV